MGGKSSKSKSNDGKKSKKDKKDKKGGKKSKRGSTATLPEQSTKERSTRASMDATHHPSKGEFADFVAEALRAKSDLVTLSDIESHISKNHRSVVDAFHRKKIIQRVVADEFSKGNVSVRLVRGGCP